MKIPKTELAYIAGLFDGEGCIRWSDTPRISLTSCWPHHLMWISTLFGYGSVRIVRLKDGKNRTTFRLEMSGKNAIRFLWKVRPFLMEKRHQADILIELVKYPKGSAKRDRLMNRLTSHKRIDYGPE
jgi:intein/homing endonuclease